jgi:hypothetical protein
MIPSGSVVNTFGGIKITINNTTIDVWADDLGTYIVTSGSRCPGIAVHPLKQKVCTWKEDIIPTQYAVCGDNKPGHICGLRGYNGMIDPPCLGCEAERRVK